MRHNNIRADLVKLIDVEVENEYKSEEMPRHRLSSSETGNFDKIMALLQQKDESVSKEAWSLIQMLTTNEQIYKEVMNITESNWANFFDASQVYSLMYKL